MKFIKLLEKNVLKYETFINEAIKFKLNDELDNIIKNIANKKKAQIIEGMLVKSILTVFLQDVKSHSGFELDNTFSNLKTQQKLDYFLNNPDTVKNNYYSNLIHRKYVQKLTSIADYVRSNNITAENFEDLYQQSVQWHEDIAKGANQEREDKVVVRKDETADTERFIEYPNGWYWVNLNTSYSADEAQNMGHCGNDDGKILFSLRDNNSNSHITVSYREDEQAMYQCKGRGNTKPREEYHKYILDLLYNETLPINLIITGSYKPHLDFNLMDLTEEEREELINKKPTLEYTDSMFEGYFENGVYEKVVAMVENGFEYNGEKKFRDLNFLKYVVKQKLDRNNYINTDWYTPSLELSTTKEDLEFYIQYYNDNVVHSKLANFVYILWKHGVVSSADAEAKIPDLKIVENKWFIKWKYEKWSDFAFMFSGDNVNGRGTYTYEEYVKNNIDEYERGYAEMDFNDCDLDDLTTETKRAILEKIEEDMKDTEDKDGNKIEGLRLSEEEIDELLNSDEDFGFDSVESFSFDLVKETILNDNGGDSLRVLLELDSFDDIRRNIKLAYEDAQEDANESEMFDTVMKPVKSFFNITEFKWEGDILLLEFDPAWAILLNKCTENARYLETLKRVVEEIFDSGVREDAYNEYNIEEDEFPSYLEFSYPYYGWSGDIDDDNLNERVKDRLHD